MPGLDQFHRVLHAIGNAIYEWQFVERALLQTLRAPFTETTAHEIAFFHLQGTGRIRFMDKIFALALSADDQKRWEKLASRVRDASDDRNAFAHHELDPHGPDDFVLRPSLFDRSRYEPDFSDYKQEPYYFDDIWESIRAFQTLANDLRNFADSIHHSGAVRATLEERLRRFPEPPLSSSPSRRAQAHQQRQQQRANAARRARSDNPR